MARAPDGGEGPGWPGKGGSGKGGGGDWLAWLPERLRTRDRRGGVGIAVLAGVFIAAGLWRAVDAPVWVLAATGLLLAWAAWIDMESCRLPDGLTVPLFAVAMAHAALGGQAAFIAGVFGAVLGYSVMRLAGAYMDWRLKGAFMMFGDAKLMAGLGGLAGWENLPALLLVSALTGLAEAGVRGWLGRQRMENGAVSFGPHLALGFVAVWLFGAGEALQVMLEVPVPVGAVSLLRGGP